MRMACLDLEQITSKNVSAYTHTERPRWRQYFLFGHGVHSFCVAFAEFRSCSRGWRIYTAYRSSRTRTHIYFWRMSWRARGRPNGYRRGKGEKRKDRGIHLLHSVIHLLHWIYIPYILRSKTTFTSIHCSQHQIDYNLIAHPGINIFPGCSVFNGFLNSTT